ncbi:MAG: hypothetical protein OEV93_01435 [Candidatus Moranbacteria bacterium]|nr:hypothetical protein [Candidatus Moranbacteria bacterium]
MKIQTDSNNSGIIGLKVGSAVVTKCRGVINEVIIEEICKQCAVLMREGKQVFIVSSGAVSCGFKKGRSRNLCAAIGQVPLANTYEKYFAKHGIEVSQHLFTDHDLLVANRVTRDTLTEAMSGGVIPIINANDTVSSRELKNLESCTDNDRLFEIVCKLVGAAIAVIGFSEDGFRGKDGEIIHQINSGDEHLVEHARGGGELGYGENGMETKFHVAYKLGRMGINSMLAPASAKDFILRSVLRCQNKLDANEKFGTLFVADNNF